MQRLFSASAALLVCFGTARAGAQLPGAGGNRIGIGRSPGRDDPAMRTVGAELELRMANGVNIIIAHARDLSLTSDQLSRVVVIKRRLDSLNSEPMRQLDSLQQLSRQRTAIPHVHGDIPDEPDPKVERTLNTLRDNVHAAEEDAYEVLSGTQLQEVLQWVKEARTNAALTTGRDRPPR
jgi:hypothetical protein